MYDGDTDKNHLLNNLRIFIDEQKTWLRNTLDSVGWNISDLETLTQTDESNLIPCSINSKHRVPQGSLLHHENRCWKKHGDYPEITDVSNLEVTIDLKDSTHSSKDCDDDFNDNLEPSDKTDKNRDEEKNKSSTCLMELLAAERDAKRRRAAHRGKRVHSNKKSYVEVLKEVISSQMETLNDASNLEPKSEPIDAEPVQRTLIQPRVDSYVGVGSKCYDGNPFKRWTNIEKEEQELIQEIQSGKHENYSDYDRRRDRSREKYKNFEKSAYDYDHNEDHHRKHREHFRDNNRHRDFYKFGDNREYYSSRSNEKRYSSYYDQEKYSKKHNDDEHLEKKREDYRSDLHEASDRREKKKERKRSRDRSNDSHDHADKHRKKRKKKSHKKKHRKSKHRDSESESD